MFSRVLKLALATSDFMNKLYNDRFAPEFSILVLKEIGVRSYVYEIENKKQNKWQSICEL